MNNIFQHMREGRSADEVLFGEKTPTEESSFRRLYDRELPLPAGRMVQYVNPNTNGHMDYRVHKVISNEGSCGIIYKMNTPQHGEYVVMKEFCPKALDTYRYTNRVEDDYDSTNTVEETVDGKTEMKVYQNYQLHYDSTNEDIIKVLQKFQEEPGRILGLLDDPNAEDAEQRFKDMNLAHPFTGCFEWQGNHYYVMKNVKGVSLYEFIREKGNSLTWKDKCLLMEQLCNALGHLHRLCVHQDVTPFNILVDENRHLTLIDFGLATSFFNHDAQTGSFHTKGTPAFTDTTSHGTEYGKLYEKDGTPKPIIVIDIFSIGMIFLYLLNSIKYQGVEKEDLIKRIAEDKLSLYFEFERHETVSSQDELIQILQNRAANILAKDSVSYEASLLRRFKSGDDTYGPFENRPKDTEEWMKRLNAINDIEADVKGLPPTDINLSYASQEVEGVAFETDDEVVCIPHENTTDSSWVTVEDGKLHVTENNGDVERNMTVYVIKGAEVKDKYKVVQKVRQELSFIPNTTSAVILPANDEKAKVKVIFETNGNWEASCNETWLKGFKPQGKAGTHTFELTAEPNKSVQMRDTKIEWKVSVDGKTEKRELAFNQPGCGIELASDLSYTLLADGEKKLLKFKAGDNCTVISDEKWLTCSEVSSVDTDGYRLVELVAGSNGMTVEREVHVTIDCCGNKEVVTYTQEAKKRKPEIDGIPREPLRLLANDKSRKVSFTFETNSDWSINDKGGLDIDKTRGRAGRYTLQIGANPNMGLKERTFVFPINLTVDGNSLDKSVTCIQPGCGIKLPTNPKLTLPAKGKPFNFTFEAGSHCTADITCFGKPVWLENRGVSRQSNGSCQLLLEPHDNETSEDRDAHVTLTCEGNQVSFVLLQSGKVQSIVPKVKFSQTEPVIFEASGGSCRLHVEADGPWTAYIENNSEWVQIIGKDKGTGNGSLVLKANPNTSVQERDLVRLVVKPVNGTNRDGDYILLCQMGRVERTVDWRGWWLRARPVVLIACILLAIGAGYGIWWSARPALVFNDAAYLEVGHDVSMAEWSFDTKGDWTAEVVDGTWLTLEQKSGHSGSNVLRALFRPKTTYSSDSARISLTCMDKSVTLKLERGYNRADSLNHVLTELREEMDRWNENGRTGNAPNYDELLNSIVRYAFHDREGKPLYDTYRTVTGELKDCRIGETHRVVDFKKNDQGKFSEIILEPIKKDR